MLFYHINLKKMKTYYIKLIKLIHFPSFLIYCIFNFFSEILVLMIYPLGSDDVKNEGPYMEM